jgi:hypothetical protein
VTAVLGDYSSADIALVAVETIPALAKSANPACHPHAGTTYLGGSPRVAIEVFFMIFAVGINSTVQFGILIWRGTTYDFD